MKIGVIGLGLIGGSILKALARVGGYELYAVSHSSFIEASFFAKIASASLETVHEADIIFVCNEMSKTLETLDALENIVRPDAIVCDVASLKSFVVTERPYKFIGTHPMAGSEKSGFDASCADLFGGAKWVITEHNDTLETLITQMGATPVLMNPTEHDFAAAQISHMPMFLAFGLCRAIQNNPLAQTLASSGFRDTTRLALTNSTLAADMLNLNAQNIDRALGLLIGELTNLKNLSYSEKIKALEAISENRKNLYDDNGKNCVSRCEATLQGDEP